MKRQTLALAAVAAVSVFAAGSVCAAEKTWNYDAATGLIEDPLDPKYGQSDQSWNGKWSYEVDRSNGLWRLFVTLPFATLGAECPAVGETWKINIGRESGDNGAGGLSLWNPNFESRQFTSPAAYGKAVFR